MEKVAPLFWLLWNPQAIEKMVNCFKYETNHSRSLGEIPKNVKNSWGFGADYLVKTLPDYISPAGKILWSKWYNTGDCITDKFKWFLQETKGTGTTTRKRLPKLLQYVIRDRYSDSNLLPSSVYSRRACSAHGTLWFYKK